MKNPPHPGRIVRQECLEPFGLTNEKAGISPEMSIRLSKAFGSSPEVWLGMQMAYDLAQLEKQASKIKVKRVTAP